MVSRSAGQTILPPMHSGERFFSSWYFFEPSHKVEIIFLINFFTFLLPFFFSSVISQQGKHGRSDSTKRDDCDKCATGTASKEVSLATPCPTCATGRAPEGEGNTACSNCLAGKFEEKNSNDEIICTECEAGQFTDSSNAPNCTACNPGDYQNEKRKTACLPCIPVRDFLFFF